MANSLVAASAPVISQPDEFQRYYEEAGPDYAAWSPAFNMHFGYFRRGMNPLNRESMLEQMNMEVLDRLHLGEVESPRVLDMGCGLGATLRTIARLRPKADLHGITLVPWQVEEGRRLNESFLHAQKPSLSLGDYQCSAYPNGSFDAVYAIESSCYGSGANKSRLVGEAHRLLRPGGRLVVADGFLGPGKLRGPQQSILRKLCECWVIQAFGEIDPFTSELQQIGFGNIHTEHAQLHVAPSVLHVPWVTIKFLLTSLVLRSGRMTRARWHNVLAPLLMPFVSQPLGPIAYYIVSATRD